MEARIARLESDVSHLRSDVSDIKVDLRALRDKVDAKFEALNSSIANAKIWALSLYIALAAVNLGTLARGFGWI
jgi:outer membrane murein-binding lipoprotein Lpp